MVSSSYTCAEEILADYNLAEGWSICQTATFISVVWLLIRYA